MAENEQRAPVRRYEIRVSVSGDDWPSAVRQLREMADHVEEHGPTCELVSGGYRSGGYVMILHDPDQSHDGYAQQLQDWLANRRREGGRA